MQIALRSPDEITPYDRNPRVNESAVDAVARSIEEFGFRQPVVVDEHGVIIVGHTRWKAAKKLGIDRIPVHVAEGLSAEKAKAYRLADNATANIAEWDLELLPVEIGELKDLGLDLDMLGFDDDELRKLLGETGNPGLADPDQIPEPPDDPVTKPGDLWVLGNHRLLCGDSASASDLDRLLDGATVQLVNTDPPYNVKVEPRSNNAISAGLSSFTAPEKRHHQRFDVARHPEKAQGTTKKMRAKDRPLVNDFVTDEAFAAMLLSWFGNLSRVLDPGRAFYIWGGYANVANYPPALMASKLYFSQTIIWDKQHPVLTRKDFMGAHEWCQPGDTAVLTPEGRVPIASLRDGDRVITFRRRDSALTGKRGSQPVRRAERDYSGPALRVVAGGRETWCTPGHIWSIRLAKEVPDRWCVYLMRRGRWWRVGKSKLLSSWGFGVKHRIKTEGGDAAWVLSVHESNLEATLHEQATQARYGLPTTTWAETYASRRTVQDVARLYEQLDLDVLEAGAMRALADHGRDPRYPFLDRDELRPKVSRRVSLTVRACNLLPEVMLVPVPEGERAGAVPWEPVESASAEPFEGKVYSLDVPHLEHYVADGMVTHNCFYGWKEGAAHKFYGPNNVPDLWPVKKVTPQSMIHLTEKPVELAARAMAYSTKPGERVLDLFGGSGSTLIAAEQQGRKAYLMEIDPAYCDVIVQRWEQFTNGKAERVSATEKAPAPAGARKGG
jgi:DNA modification methylase